MNKLESRIRLAGMVIAIGLLTQLATLVWVHPLSLIACALIAAPIVLTGIGIFLFSVVSARQQDL